MGLNDMEAIDQFELNPDQLEDISETLLVSMKDPHRIAGSVMTYGIGAEPIPKELLPKPEVRPGAKKGGKMNFGGMQTDDEIIDYFLENNQSWVICEYF